MNAFLRRFEDRPEKRFPDFGSGLVEHFMSPQFCARPGRYLE